MTYVYALIHTHTEKIPVSHNLCVLVMPPLLAVIGLMKQADTAVLRLVIRLTDKVERTAVSLRETQQTSEAYAYSQKYTQTPPQVDAQLSHVAIPTQASYVMW